MAILVDMLELLHYKAPETRKASHPVTLYDTIRMRLCAEHIGFKKSIEESVDD